MANNFPQQQDKFDRFTDCYNHQRPDQAIVDSVSPMSSVYNVTDVSRTDRT